MKAVGLIAVAIVGMSGCNASIAAETYKSPAGVAYKIERVATLKAEDLPQNSDLKMVDGDLAKYAVEACSIDVKVQFAPGRCDIYVQPDKSGTLIGYAVITQDKDGARLNTITTLNAQKQSRGATTCGLQGIVYGDGENYSAPVKDASRDFGGQITYSAWEKDPSNWLVSQVKPDDTSDQQGALGVWYVKKQGDKLRINQERWNYCYTDSGVYMDDVFSRAISLIRQAG